MRTLQWVNPLTGLVFVICAVVGFWFTAAAFFVITVIGVYRYGMLTRKLAAIDATETGNR